MSIYFTDKVQITPVTRDANFRTETEGTPFSSDAYVEEDDRVVYGSDGAPLKPVRRIFLPYETSISEGDFVKITKKNGFSITDTNKKVSGISYIGSFIRSHLEVFCNARQT